MKKRLKSKQLRHRYGGVSDMTIWRWLRDPDLGFPKPLYIRGIRYWDEEELDAFDAAQRGTEAV